jgi:hypothetical protein
MRERAPACTVSCAIIVKFAPLIKQKMGPRDFFREPAVRRTPKGEP